MIYKERERRKRMNELQLKIFILKIINLIFFIYSDQKHTVKLFSTDFLLQNESNSSLIFFLNYFFLIILKLFSQF